MKALKFGFIVLLIFTFFLFSSQKAEWKGKIEYEDGVKVIKNPKNPIYDNDVLLLE